MENKIIAVDFDGTLCENRYPQIGKPNRETIDYIKKRQQDGAKIVLWTCRIDELLDDAVRWSRNQGLIFDAVNENMPEIIAEFGTDTRKIFANEYIDDRNASFALEFSSKEKQIIWDALYRYQYELYKSSQSNHFAKDEFAKEYDLCIALMKRIDEKWNICH